VPYFLTRKIEKIYLQNLKLNNDTDPKLESLVIDTDKINVLAPRGS
jgi:hypothetical protein